MSTLCLNCGNDLKIEFFLKIDSDLVGFTLLWVKQDPGNESKSILGFLELSPTFGPAKLSSGSDLSSEVLFRLCELFLKQGIEFSLL